MNNKVIKHTDGNYYIKLDNGNYSKVLATTDKSLRSLFGGQEVLEEPYPLSKQSTQILVDYYNKNGKMPDKVEVETVRKYAKNPEFYGTGMFNNGYSEEIKLNPQGEVDIIISELSKQSIEEAAEKYEATVIKGTGEELYRYQLSSAFLAGAKWGKEHSNMYAIEDLHDAFNAGAVATLPNGRGFAKTFEEYIKNL